MKACLVLADGTVFPGVSVGATGETAGRVIFHTGVVGFEGILSDPASRGQIIGLTYPLVGNYGVNPDDMESRVCHAAGLVVKEISRTYSNWRASGSLQDFLHNHQVVAISGVDTRALTLHLREHGEMYGIISTLDIDPAELATQARSSAVEDTAKLVTATTCREPQTLAPLAGRNTGARVAVVDLGTPRSLLNQLLALNCHITLLPPGTPAGHILGLDPDGVVLAGGPGDGAALTGVVATTRELLGQIPLLGVGLGCQVLGGALGGATVPMHRGHHGANQAIRHTATGKVEVSSQRHSFVLDAGSLPANVVVTWTNLVDGTVEGIISQDQPALGYQYQLTSPEAGQTSPELREFADLMAKSRRSGKERR